MSLNLDHELHKEMEETKRSTLDISKNPLLISILDAVDTLRLLQTQGKLPVDCFKHTKGFLMMKIGFGLSVTQGYGLVITRMPGTPIGWSSPLPVKVDGFGVGGVMGWSEQHTIIAMATDTDVNAFTADKRAMKIGVDFGVNLLDKYDKSAALNTQTGLHLQKDATSGGQTRAFTISKGMMVDMSLQGTSVEPDIDDIRSAYGPHVTPSDILTSKVAAPREALLLYKEIRSIEQRSSAPAS